MPSTRILAALLATLLALIPLGCEKKYAQDTPEAVLDSAKAMVLDRRAHRLPDLLYADSPQLRTFLTQIGGVMGALQDLSTAVQKAYPKEIEKLRAEAEEAAKKGEATSFIQRLSAQAGGQQRRGRRNQQQDGPPDEATQQQFNRLFRDLFANPYGFLETESDRLTVKQITDDTAAILWDGKPLLGVGLTMRKDADKWYIVLPTNAPGFNRILPSTKEGWEIFGELAAIGENLFIDLKKDVESGEVPRLEDLAARAGDRAFLPMAIGFLAYSRARDADRQAQREAQRAAQQNPQPTTSTPPAPR